MKTMLEVVSKNLLKRLEKISEDIFDNEQDNTVIGSAKKEEKRGILIKKAGATGIMLNFISSQIGNIDEDDETYFE